MKYHKLYRGTVVGERKQYQRWWGFHLHFRRLIVSAMWRTYPEDPRADPS